MTEEQKDQIMEIACDLCWYPCIACSQDWLDEKCDNCPLARLLDEVSE